MGDVWKAMADPTRREILFMLKSGDMNAGEIAEKFDISKPSISNHLNILRQADLVRAEKQGQNMVYSLKTSAFEDILGMISDLAHREDNSRKG